MQNPKSGNWTTKEEAIDMRERMNASLLAKATPITFVVYQNIRTKQYGVYPRGLQMPKSYRVIA